ncbi:MAG TPA: tRNA (N6-threonylcarbamoyladenosine(37)-N6)-methyltransferase TrmO [Caldisericia bacterium]|nr:tRNA (N6-threonylcarbamoyladenosine(37)-N6)-methyltransferase TrmO [Caldisericia bacterium]HPF49737.1 tRNA (N6-threonylcarbamoyladenosine(37)-N6)-methyltransferase TrmO [Caldisericia bacterium]HPI84299.1 tRNA (N6-threonylcarbamoyladenosine(37)-N6)-methyltransferase TrmO [Caldisericia bacterium]HPQ93726.1 tRNA (N6-threonylcarbamoyladenosine(37)-N6)-methyltransferase TrmO [Caldisericia bacterium]HRV74850.1 tRNA (N6-threonylcarbamoyladenosine(37)-N6)-methyltransferase TrmO [Caldisericia bacteri
MSDFSEPIVYKPIGYIRSRWTEPGEDVPRSPRHAKGEKGTIEILPEYIQCLDGLLEFSHIVVLAHLHKSRAWKPLVTPPGETEPRGLFATRSPNRPNPIAMSEFKLVGIEGNRLFVEDVDLIDGTAVLDVKPYYKLSIL